ncbi:gamma-glutamyltransferase family protein [Brevundimonas sp.]|jgi:gamma-glutamyltranspeptidase / glutathione hydrolase|uniref:gamma-glutamyltransferase family protein n=1 Tax=Brevundimonas sp. TaxID=1871086 RepID=UPI001A209C45|nr:gamma-glutamyltransferase family protein [Brevundimonas sp.]MBJ7510176.1 gamma-glutamyltransferase family protein [Brevundimonas sp.]
MLFLRRRLVSLLVAAVSVPTLLAGCQTPAAAPWLEARSDPAGAPSIARGPFVAAANPLAVEAGMKVLRRGGSAVDAAVAVQAVLGLVEPQSSGLGGGAFLMSYEAKTGRITAYDGRETAPASATPELFYEDGKPLPFIDAILSGRSAGAPGAVAMLAMAQGDHGRLAWRDLFEDAERLARDGFVVSPRLAGMINGPWPQAKTRWASALFTGPDGRRYQAGDVMRNPAYARTVQALAAEGPGVFYGGRIGREIARTVAEGPRPGGLTEADIAAYRPLRRDALCRPYRIYVICVPPPPSSGVALLQFLAMAEHTPDIQKGADSPEAWVAFGRLQRLMYADRDRYVGDADFVGVPVAGLLDPAYVAQRAALVPEIDGPVPAGAPPGSAPRSADATAEPGGTSHMVIVDADGNAVSMTTTVESIFGDGRVVEGFFLNNQLTDFSFTPTEDGHPAANAVAAGKRPRSSMTPVLILDRQGRLVGAIGSPGGSSILAYVAKALVGMIDWKLPVQEAIALPNLVVRGGSVGADTAQIAPDIAQALGAAGMGLRSNATETSGLHGAMWRDGRWDGGADPRREGVAVSEAP